MSEVHGGTTIDTTSEAFARRLGNLLIATRERRNISPRALVRASGNRFSRFDLKAIEAGTMRLDDSLIEEVTELYQADLGSILPLRLPVVVGPGIITAGGVSTVFVPEDSTSLLRSYLLLVRSMRRQKKAPAVDLRREDVDVLATYLGETGESVIMRLGALMGATRTQRTAMASLFASGAVVIGLVGSVAAAGGGSVPSSGAATGAGSTTISATYDGHDSRVSETPAAETPADTPVDTPADIVVVTTVADEVPTTVVDVPVEPAAPAPAATPSSGSGGSSAPASTPPATPATDPAPVTSDVTVVDPTALGDYNLNDLIYTPAADPIIFDIGEPAITDTGLPPVPTTTIVVDTTVPPVPGA